MNDQVRSDAGQEPEEPDLLRKLQQDRDGSFAYSLVRELSDKARQSPGLPSVSAQAANDRAIAFQTAAEIIERFAGDIRQSVRR